MIGQRLLFWAPVAAIAVAPLVLSSYFLTLMHFIGLAAIVTLGLVLLTGMSGLTSFGQASFVGIGAYTTAFLTGDWGISPWIALLVVPITTGAAALLIGAITLRLSGHYLPLSTIAWSLGLVFLAGNLDVVGGHNGITGLPRLSLADNPLSDRAYAWLIWAFVLLALLSIRNLLSSRDGRAIRCLHGRCVMAESFGIDTARMKIAIFIHAAVLAGLSGWLYAHLVQFVNPTPFGLNIGIEYLFMTVIGGVTSLGGAIFGAGVLILIRDGLQDIVPSLLGSGGAAENIVFGLLMIAILLYAPKKGFMAGLRRLAPGAATAVLQGNGNALPLRAKPARGSVLLEAEGVSRRFGGLLAVHNVSFTLRAGEIVALIGPNGAGKSTLFNLLSGVLAPSGGGIRFCGDRIDGKPSRAIARLGIARSFQHVQLNADMSALENAALGAYMRGHKSMMHAIMHSERAQERSLMLEGKRQMERLGLGDYLFTPAGALALGQQRILEISRALAADPILLLLDEPAAGLRLSEKQELAVILRELKAQGLSILIVEHDMSFVMSLADRLIVMDFGQKIAEGIPSDIQKNDKVRQAYLGVVA